MKSQLGLTRSDDRTEDCACGADDDVIPSPAHVQKATISDDRSHFTPRTESPLDYRAAKPTSVGTELIGGKKPGLTEEEFAQVILNGCFDRRRLGSDSEDS
jgi:hypothetical protein